MFTHRWRVALFRLGMGLGLVLGNAACTAMPPPASSVAAADPAVRVPATRYSSVTPAVGTLAPVEPEPWQDLNQNVAPAAPPKGREP
jgi:hypothetical protein